MRTVEDILGKQNSITGLLNQTAVNNTTLIGSMSPKRNSSKENFGGAVAGNVRITPNRWIEQDGEYIYQYQNSTLKGNYFLQIIPLLETPEEIEKFNAIGIKPYITTNSDSDVYLFHASNKPTTGFDVMILATKIDNNIVKEADN